MQKGRNRRGTLSYPKGLTHKQPLAAVEGSYGRNFFCYLIKTAWLCYVQHRARIADFKVTKKEDDDVTVINRYNEKEWFQASRAFLGHYRGIRDTTMAPRFDRFQI